MTDTMSRRPSATTRWPLLPGHQPSKNLLVLALLSTISSVTATNCYTPDGTISNDRPCNASASASVCCTQGFICTSNQLCQPANWWNGTGGNPLQFIRGTCTDKTWAAPECQGHCVADNPSGGEWVMRCGASSNNYCCSADDCCSRASFLRFVLDEPTITATAGIEPTSTTTSTTPTTSTTSTTDASTKAPTKSPTAATTGMPTSSTPSTSSPAPATTTNSNSSSDGSGSKSGSEAGSGNSSSSSTTPIAIGVGVGVGVGVVIVGCLLALILIRLRRKKRIAAQQTNPVFASMPQMGHPGVYPPVARVQVHPWELDSQPPPAVAELDGVHTTKFEVR